VNCCVHSNSAVLVPTQISLRPLLPRPAPVLLEGGSEAAQHSMNMGMVRDSAVGNFVERLQRSVPADNTAEVPRGWLELRKGVHSTT
jgi:hypothetical protein